MAAGRSIDCLAADEQILVANAELGRVSAPFELNARCMIVARRLWQSRNASSGRVLAAAFWPEAVPWPEQGMRQGYFRVLCCKPPSVEANHQIELVPDSGNCRRHVSLFWKSTTVPTKSDDALITAQSPIWASIRDSPTA